MSDFKTMLKRIKSKTRKYKYKINGSNSKDRNYALNRKQAKMRPDVIVLRGKKRVGLNKERGSYHWNDDFSDCDL